VKKLFYHITLFKHRLAPARAQTKVPKDYFFTLQDRSPASPGYALPGNPHGFRVFRIRRRIPK
jgi:hypothetical protein